MLNIADIAKGFLEEKLASGELKILKEPKNPRLFDPSIEDKIKAKQGICITCGHKMDKTLKGDMYCSRRKTKCNSFIKCPTT